jgi:hypothetical protein
MQICQTLIASDLFESLEVLDARTFGHAQRPYELCSCWDVASFVGGKGLQYHHMKSSLKDGTFEHVLTRDRSRPPSREDHIAFRTDLAWPC